MTGWQIRTGLTQDQVTGVMAVAEAAGATDGVAPLSERIVLHLRYEDSAADRGCSDPGPGPGRDYVVLTAAVAIAAYAYLDPPGMAAEPSGELVVHPVRRRQGLGRALVRKLAADADGRTLRLWAHGDLPAAAGLAEATGFQRFRALWQMRRSLRDPLGRPDFPVGRSLRTFVPGQDEQEWLSLNGRAFAKHPEQGTWTRHDLDLREREPWFDPTGFFIAERDGLMAGFHWTKVHPHGMGEVYVVGVDPAEQGSGLGRALTLAGLRYLRGQGLAQAMLYVDEDNVPAIRMYESLGFTRARTDAMYRQLRR